METTQVKREKFSSSLAVFFATLGSAVGLGNIWKFPTLTGEGGGAAFILVYLGFVLILGIPVMIAEFYIGRRSRTNAIGAFTKLKAKPIWKVTGLLGVIASVMIITFYSSVAGWVYAYVVKAISGVFKGISTLGNAEAVQMVEQEFIKVTDGNLAPIIWQGVVLLVVGFIIIAGIRKGIEKCTKTLMPILFVLIVLCCARALTLDGATEGLRFLFKPDFTNITVDTILLALGLAFFKLSLGSSCMITYASYFNDSDNLVGTSAKVAFSDTIVSMLMGIAIFPVVFQFGLEPSAGPGLLFNTIPLVFSQMPLGNILLIVFFLLTAMAATMAAISMLEVVVSVVSEQFKLNRTKTTIGAIIIIFIIGALTVHNQSIFASTRILGNNFFDFFDKFSSNIILPVVGILIALFMGYVVKKEDLEDELTNHGTLMKNKKLVDIYRFVIRYVTPILIVIVFISGLI